MILINRILLPIDFSFCSDQLLDHALHLARKYKADLIVYHAIVLYEDDPHNPAHIFPDIQAISDKLHRTARIKMEAAADSHRGLGIRIETIQERGFSASEMILRFVEDHDVDLIVMGTRGRRFPGPLLLGSVAEKVVRHATVPVLTIRGQKNPGTVDTIEHILVPVDFSDHSRNALAHARDVAATFGARLQLLHVVEDVVHPIFYTATGKTSLFDLRPNLKSRSEEELERLFEDTPGPDVDHEVHCVDGHAAGEIVRFASEQNTNLIIMATHGLSELSQVLIGSVTQRVVRRAPCPVFTVNSSGRSLGHSLVG